MPARLTGRPAGYPAELESEVLLANGRVAEVRPIVPGDAGALVQDLGSRLSPESLYMRFFSPKHRFSEAEIDHFVTVDYEDRLALVAFVDDELVAVARYERLPGDPEATDAEVAFTVRDDQQGRGIGMVLLEHLASAARSRGIRHFQADTLAQNRRMLDVFRRAGFEETATFDAGVVHVKLDLEANPTYLDQVEERDRVAAVRSIERLLRPSSIAVVGASRRDSGVGTRILQNLKAGAFRGSLFAVNPSAREILGCPAYPDVAAIPQAVDLAVVAVPPSSVQAVVESCGRKGVGGVVIVTAGFAEAGQKGAAAERRLVATARGYGMRLVGPNCLGIVNTAEDVSMNATFSPVRPVPGHIAFSSQSGGLGIAILNEATFRDLGVSLFVSVGNKADVSGNDLIRYFEADENTDVILLYLESFGNPRHFAQIARRTARRKPIVAVKSGRSSAGTRGATSHTAAMASPDAVVDALFRQAGVIRVDTLEELFDVADVLLHQPLPEGRRVGIVCNAGGPGVLAADACEGAGLFVPELAAATQEKLRELLSPEAAVSNPVDCIATATARQYGRALELVLEDESIDAAIAIFTPPLVTQADDAAVEVARVAEAATKPVLANFLATTQTLSVLRTSARRVPLFTYPEPAARALARIVPYAAFMSRPEVPVPVFTDIDRSRGRAVVERRLGQVQPVQPAGSSWLSLPETLELLASYGIPCVESIRATSPAEAAIAAQKLGGKVVLKLDAPGLVHKSDVGGVLLDLDPSAVEAEAERLLSGSVPEAAVIVQPMVASAPETIVGVVEEPGFGPVVMFGLGGTATEVIGDRALSLVPMTRPQALELISSVKASKLLTGYRGAPASDIPALADLVCRVAQLAGDLPEVNEMDLNPVIAGPDGCIVLDPKVRVQRVKREPELRRRHIGG